MYFQKPGRNSVKTWKKFRKPGENFQKFFGHPDYILFFAMNSPPRKKKKNFVALQYYYFYSYSI